MITFLELVHACDATPLSGMGVDGCGTCVHVR